MPTKTYTHRVVISRPDEIYRDDQDESCEPLGVYVLFESEAQARDYALQFIAERLIPFSRRCVAYACRSE